MKKIMMILLTLCVQLTMTVYAGGQKSAAGAAKGQTVLNFIHWRRQSMEVQPVWA
jgi:hypothetical protein